MSLFLSKSQLYRKVAACRNYLSENDVTGKIDIGKICSVYKNIDIKYIPIKTQGLRGMVALATEEEPLHCIIINSLLSPEEKKFHSIHEFMHIYLHSGLTGTSFNCFDEIRPNQDFSLEWQANEGSAELLIPYREFIPLFSNLYAVFCEHDDWWESQYNGANITEVLAEHYGVTEPVINNRISALAYEIDQYRGGKPVDQLQIMSFNKQKSYGIQTTDYCDVIKRVNLRYCFKSLA